MYGNAAAQFLFVLVGWAKDSQYNFGEENSTKLQLVNLISSIQIVMRG